MAAERKTKAVAKKVIRASCPERKVTVYLLRLLNNANPPRPNSKSVAGSGTTLLARNISG